MKNKEFRTKNFDYFYFEYLLPADNEPANRGNQDTLTRISTDNQNITSEAERPITFLLTEALFKGQFETGKPKPFYFGEKKESDVLFWGKGKTLADMICEVVGDIPCCNPVKEDCDINICIGEETKVLAKLATMMESLIQKRFDSIQGSDLIELPMWHFTFIQFNKYEWGDQSCGK